MTDVPVEVRFYTRPGCHLCDRARDVVGKVLGRYPLPLRILNVEDDPTLEARYGEDLPVVEVASPEGTRTFRHHLSQDELESELAQLWNT